MDNQDLINLLLELSSLSHETEWVEFKLNNSNLEDIGEYISALSNSACYHKKDYGYLVYGVSDRSHELVGTNFKPTTQKKGNEELENWLAVKLDPRIDFNFFEFTYEGLNFVIIRIQATVNTPVMFKNSSYIRIGSYKKQLKDHPEKERAIWNQESKNIFEKGIAFKNVKEEDVLKLIDYPGYFDLIGLALPDNRKGILERLTQDKIIQKNGNEFNIFNIGAILFAKDINLFDEKLSRKAVRFIIYSGNNRVNTVKEQVGIRGYALGFSSLIDYVEDQLPMNEIIDKALRRKEKIYPTLALRELIANAIVHQDFSVTGSSPMIEVFANRVEITNPGKPLIDPLRFVDHSPESRNEILAKFMRRLNICEERGSGFDKVIFQCEFNQLPAPEIIVGENYTRVIMYKYKKLSAMDKKDKVRACYLHACLKSVSGEYMTNQSLRERFGISESNYPIASRIINDTVQDGLVKVYDPNNKSRKYAKYLPFWA